LLPTLTLAMVLAAVAWRRLGGAALGGAAALALQQGGGGAHCRTDRRPLPLLSRLDSNKHPDDEKVLGVDPSGKSVVLRTLKNGAMRVRVMDWGATITSVRVPDKDGVVGEVALGFDELAPYVDGRSPYFGCVAGRYANRIQGGHFQLDGQGYTLVTNNGPNALHGGLVGFDKRHWVCQAASDTSVTLALLSEDGEEGYPGNLLAKVTYSLPTEGELRMEYEAVCDKPTVVNLTNHSYWNLQDGGARSVKQHEVQLAARLYTPVDETSIPTGEVRAVGGAMDLTSPTPIGKGLAQADGGMGYDHNYVLTSPPRQDGLRACGRVYEPTSGRCMTVTTDQPGVQFYTAGYLDGSLEGRGGAKYHKFAGFCLETQHFPDSPNHPHFPSTVLRRGEVYRTTTVYKFDASPSPPTGPIA